LNFEFCSRVTTRFATHKIQSTKNKIEQSNNEEKTL